MRKLLFISAVIAAIAPGIIAGVDTDGRTRDDKRAAMLEQRFISYCQAHGRDYYSMTESQRDAFYFDVWTETPDYQTAADSIDSVLTAERRDYLLK